MEERGMNERVRMLRRQSVETQPHIYMERAKLMTEAYKLYDGSMSVPEMRATALKYYFQHKTIEIADGELIVGEKGDTAQAAPKPCDELKAEIAAKLEAKGVKGYILEAVEADKVAADAKVVGSCEAGSKKIVYTRS